MLIFIIFIVVFDFSDYFVTSHFDFIRDKNMGQWVNVKFLVKLGKLAIRTFNMFQLQYNNELCAVFWMAQNLQSGKVFLEDDKWFHRIQHFPDHTSSSRDISLSLSLKTLCLANSRLLVALKGCSFILKMSAPFKTLCTSIDCY